MGKIHQLPLHEIQKIAAGQVIDSPSDVVKELIENSLDAGATYIKIFIHDGGKQLIRIVDNGCGMSADDAQCCFLPHTTSKMTTLGDLEALATFGFRGEALSSIASVCHVSICTKEENSPVGCELELENNNIVRQETSSLPTGTDVRVSDLFYNVPARKKFLKQTETEWRRISRLVQAFCLCHRNIHLELYNRDERIINCPPADSYRERVAQLWDYSMAQAMVEIFGNNSKNCELRGLISHHQYTKYDRSYIFVFVNNRWVKNHHIIKALLKGYANIFQPGRFPVAVVSITVDPSHVDINIHPRKEEVKFLHPQIIETLVTESVKHAVHHNQVSTLTPIQNSQPKIFTFDSSSSRDQHDSWTVDDFIKPLSQKVQQVHPVQEQQKDIDCDTQPVPCTVDQTLTVQPVCNDVPSQLEIITEQQPRFGTIIGQYKKTYIIVEHQNGIMMIDQHAAHERILYEKFRSRTTESATIALLFPLTISLSGCDYRQLEQSRDILQNYGIIVEPFSQTSFIVSSVPALMQNIDFSDFIQRFLSSVKEQSDDAKCDVSPLHDNAVSALMACTSAIKAGDLLSMQQMESLVSELANTENNMTCPHGRPTRWLILQTDLEKKFKRDYRSSSRQE